MREGLFVVTLVFLTGCRNTPAPAVAPETGAPAIASATSAGSTPASTSPQAVPPVRFTFDADATDAAPKGFSFGGTGKKPGRWIVRAEKDAPSGPNVLVQVDADEVDMRFPVAVADAPILADARVSVRCKPISGKVDQACGLVLRYQDANNYFVTRANALEGNVRLYFVKAGERKQIASYSGEVKGGVWHDYRFEVRGDHLEVTWDGKKVLDHHDATFMTSGKAGVWTKADSVTAFDDLTVEAL